MESMKKHWMKLTLAAISLAIFLGFIVTFITRNNDKSFVVMIPSYNNKDWYKKNLDSVFSQTYQNYRIIYVDDASPDGTGELVKQYIKEKGQEHRVTLIQNDKRVGSLANVYKAVWLAKPSEIIIDLDGDDWLANENVLKFLNDVYADPNVWVTYGQFQYYPDPTPGWAGQVPDDVIENNSFRETRWLTTALRTFYAGLFQKIKKDDLLYSVNEFFPMAGDLAFMFPIVEMAGKHSRFIPEVLYIYNVATQINDVVLNRNYQHRLGLMVRGRPKYTPVDSPY
jgi:glycosyltransferase involved in cell wall biosynthesis